jgi:hypothetical protein
MNPSQTPLTMSEFDEYYALLQESALKVTKHAAGLPSDLAFHRSVDSDVAKDLDACSSKVVSVTNILLDFASTIGGSKSAKGKGKARLQDEDDFCDRFGALIVEPMDQLLERAVRSMFRPFALLSPYPGHRVGSIFRQDESACHCYQPSRTEKEKGGACESPGRSHSACGSPPETAAQVQAGSR